MAASVEADNAGGATAARERSCLSAGFYSQTTDPWDHHEGKVTGEEITGEAMGRLMATKGIQQPVLRATDPACRARVTRWGVVQPTCGA